MQAVMPAETFPDPPRVPEGMTVTAIGDVHGQLDLLEPILREIEARAARQRQRRHVVVLLGDLIDRGPNSAGVIERLVRGVAGCEVVGLRGNHEDAMLAFLAGDVSAGRAWLDFGGIATLTSYGITATFAPTQRDVAALSSQLAARLPPAHFAFLRDLSLTATIGDYLFVHAGLRPGRSLEQQTDQDLVWIREEFLRCETRFEKKVVHGHTPVPLPDFRDNRINLDTGAYSTGRLTAAVFEDAYVSLM
jgi:serine/threonine protein phosphatase 1